MIKKFFFLTVMVSGIVIIEGALAIIFQTRWMPDFCLLFVIFTTLSLDFRYGFGTAVVAGFLKESLPRLYQPALSRKCFSLHLRDATFTR